MARPLKEGLDYFPHDTDAVSDEKIEVLRALYGNDGYAFYFITLERIYRSKDAELDVSTSGALRVLSNRVGVRLDKFERMLETAFEVGCFDRETFNNSKKLTSNGIRHRASFVLEKRLEMRKKYAHSKLDEQRISSPISDAETREETPQSKVNKSKVNNYIGSLFRIWNEQGIIVHKNLTDDIKRAIKSLLEIHSFEEIAQGIKNYAIILHSEEYYFKYSWTLIHFLKRGLDMFLDLEVAKGNYRRDKEKLPARNITYEDVTND